MPPPPPNIYKGNVNLQQLIGTILINPSHLSTLDPRLLQLLLTQLLKIPQPNSSVSKLISLIANYLPNINNNQMMTTMNNSGGRVPTATTTASPPTTPTTSQQPPIFPSGSSGGSGSSSGSSSGSVVGGGSGSSSGGSSGSSSGGVGGGGGGGGNTSCTPPFTSSPSPPPPQTSLYNLLSNDIMLYVYQRQQQQTYPYQPGDRIIYEQQTFEYNVESLDELLVLGTNLYRNSLQKILSSQNSSNNLLQQ